MLNDTMVILNNEKLLETQLEKIFALKALKENPGILGNVFSFEKLVYVINGQKPNVDALELCSILMIAKAIKILGLEHYDWHSEVKKYIAAIAHDEGWVDLPEILKFAQPELSELHKHTELNEDQTKMQELKHQAVEKYLVLNV